MTAVVPSLALCLSSWKCTQAGITTGPTLAFFSGCELSHVPTDSAGAVLGNGSLEEDVSRSE